MFALANCICMGLMILLFYPLLFFILTKNNPFKFMVIIMRPYITTLAASSTAVAIPDMFDVCETKLGVDSRISRFIIPFGDALNRTGSCCFIVIATLFLCNLENADLKGPQYFAVALMTWVSGFAIPSVPSASIISVLIIMSSVNVQTTNIGLLLALEWLLDRLRCSVQAIAIINGAVLTNRLCKDDLKKRLDPETVIVSTDVEVDVTQQNNVMFQTYM